MDATLPTEDLILSGDNIDTSTVTLWFVVAIPVFIVLWYRISSSSPKRLPPGPRAWPILGNLPQLGLLPHLSLMKMSEKYGPIFRIYFASDLCVVLSDYESIKKAYVQDGCSGRIIGTIVDEFTDRKGLIMSDGELWKEHRRFALSTLRDLGMGKSWLQEQILEEVEVIAQSLYEQNGQPFDPAHLITNGVSNIICAAVFGKRFSYDNEEFRLLLHTLRESIKQFGQSNLMVLFPSLKYLPYYRQDYRRMKAEDDFFFDHMEKMIQEASKTRGYDSPDYVNAFLREADRQKEKKMETTFQSKQLKLSVANMFVAGTETTSSTLLLGFLHMVENPDIMKRVQNELDSVVGQTDSVRFEHRGQLPFTEATLLELLRMESVAPIGVFHRTTETIQLDKYTLPKDTLVISNIYAVHHNPSVFKSPDTFDPSKFLDEQGRFVKSPYVIPFSVGKRACLGESLAQMELFLIFTNILHKFDLVVPEGETVSSKNVSVAVTINPNPYKLIFKKRF